MNELQLKLCDIQGRLFELSASKHYASSVFIKVFMNSSVAKALDSSYNRMQWAGEEYLLEEIVANSNIDTMCNGEIFSKDVLYWIGYIYRYWHYYTGEESSKIYKQAPVDIMKRNPKTTAKDIADELDGLPPEKMHCSVMGHEALEDALRKYFKDEKKSSEKIICTCFGVTEKQIYDAIKENGLTTVEEVTNYTKAGGACGRCKGLIADIIVTCNKKNVEETKMTSTQLVLKVNKIIETLIAPELQKDGGDIELIDIQGYKVMVKLYGRCSACKNSIITLKNFVETTLKEKISKEIEVVQV